MFTCTYIYIILPDRLLIPRCGWQAGFDFVKFLVLGSGSEVQE